MVETIFEQPLADLNEAEPTFIVRLIENAFGMHGPALCWPNGTIVPAQAKSSFAIPADGIASITVTFHIGTGVVVDRTADWVDPNTTGEADG